MYAQPQGGGLTCAHPRRVSFDYLGASRQCLLPAWPNHSLRPANGIGPRGFRGHRASEGNLSRPLYSSGAGLRPDSFTVGSTTGFAGIAPTPASMNPRGPVARDSSLNWQLLPIDPFLAGHNSEYACIAPARFTSERHN